jgi:GNAT superfamily N-acetyltransferase
MIASNPSEPVIELRKDNFLLSTDPRRLDLAVIHGFLCESYWAKGIPRETVARSVVNSLCFGVYDGGRQVAFARVISDFATYAYLADVFVLEPFRGRGLGKWMLQSIVDHPRLQRLRRWSLVTEGAHGLYAQFGFTPTQWPERYMERYDADVYEHARA